MTWLKALREHWLKFPPVHKIAAVYAGYKAPDSKPVPAKPNDPVVIKITPIDGQVPLGFAGGPFAP